MLDLPEVPETKPVIETRQLLWMIWERCGGGLDRLKGHPEALAGLFDDFLIDNLDLFREVQSGIGTFGCPSPELLQKVEQAAVPKWLR